MEPGLKSHKSKAVARTGKPGAGASRKAEPTDSELEDKIDLLIDEGKNRRAERLLRRMLETQPNSVFAHFHLARVYRRINQDERALYHAHRTLSLSPGEANARLNLGLIYECMGRTALAFRNYKRELKRNPDSLLTRFNLGHLYFNKHQWRRASQCFQRCFDARFPYAVEEMVHKLGHCYFKLNDVHACIELYKNYVLLEPDSDWATANLGSAMLHAKDYKGAVLRLTRAARLGSSVEDDLAKAKKLYRKERMAKFG